jgi:signal transduction histidine kinase
LSLANNWYVISPQLETAKERLTKLSAMLQRHPDALIATQERREAPKPFVPPANVSFKDAEAVDKLGNLGRMDVAQDQASKQELQQRAIVANVSNSNNKLTPEELPKKKQAEPSIVSRSRVSSAVPAEKLAKAETASPASAPLPAKAKDIGDRMAGSAKSRFDGSISSAPSAASIAAAPSAPPDPAPADVADAAKPVAMLESANGNLGSNLLKSGTGTLTVAGAGGFAKESPVTLSGGGAVFPVKGTVAPVPTEPLAATSTPGDLKPRWLEDELLLVRTATLDNRSRLQGLWLDWPGLRTRLLEAIIDLLPNAELSATDPAWLDAASLVTLPVRLLPGPVAIANAEPSPLRRSLAIAWACFLIAALAVGIVLNRAIVLSERRGAFVSAVTHELRTPLTTFQLYSEMLADDMVPDPAQRRAYLRTLCDESTRLTHLVENVLSYSRIERGRAAARREDVRLGDLIARIEPRLRQRSQPAGLDLQVSIAPEAADTVVNVDAVAIEQIVFNLVDNACKYAAPASREPVLRLEVNLEPRAVAIRVCDQGPGLSKQQCKRLFRPFEKSATEAAHSAPGVGLGLALCRRLARELGGELELEPRPPGACFKLTVPRVA